MGRRSGFAAAYGISRARVPRPRRAPRARQINWINSSPAAAQSCASESSASAFRWRSPSPAPRPRPLVGGYATVRDRRSDLGLGARDFEDEPAEDDLLKNRLVRAGHQDGARVRPDQDRRPPARRRQLGLHQRRPGTATTTHAASTTGSKLTYTRLAARQRPGVPLGARPRNPN